MNRQDAKAAKKSFILNRRDAKKPRHSKGTDMLAKHTVFEIKSSSWRAWRLGG
jgi:hypothetical protein